MSNTPFTRNEQYLNAIANGETNVPEPFTREEQYLYEIATNGSGGASSASDVTYDNTSSGLTASNVQAAIDEVAQSGGGGITYDIIISGTSTIGDEPTASDLSGATMTYNTTITEMITKISEKGTIDIKGQLHYNGSDGIVNYVNVAADKYPNEIVPYAAVAYYAGLLQKPDPKVDQGGVGLTIHATNSKASSSFHFYLYEDEDGTIQEIVM